MDTFKDETYPTLNLESSAAFNVYTKSCDFYQRQVKQHLHLNWHLQLQKKTIYQNKNNKKRFKLMKILQTLKNWNIIPFYFINKVTKI